MADKRAHELAAMPAADAATAGNLAVVATSGGLLKSSRFDVLMGALGRLRSRDVLDADYTGATDATADIQGQIDDAYNAGGRKLELPFGQYLATNIVAKSGVHIEGVPDKRQFYYNAMLLQSGSATGPLFASDYPAATSDPANRLIGCQLENVAFQSQNASETAPVVRIRYSLGLRWRNVYILAGSTSQTVLELADVWDSSFDDLVLQEGEYSLAVTNRGDIDNCNNLVFRHPHFESPRKGWFKSIGATGSTHQNTKLTFVHPKWEGHIISSGVAGCQLQYTNNVKVFGGFSGTPPNGAGTPPSTFPMLHVLGDVHDVYFAGHGMENDGQQIGSYVKVSGTNNWGIKLQLAVDNTTLAPTDGLVTFANGANVRRLDLDVYSFYDDSGMTAADYVGSIAGATITRPRLMVDGIDYTKPTFSADGVLNTENGIQFQYPDTANTVYLGRGSKSGGNQGFRLLDGSTEIFVMGTDDKLYIPAKTVLGGFGVGADISSVRTGTATWDPASTADGAMTSTTVTVTGAAIGDPVWVGFSNAVPAGAILTGSVTASNTVTVTLFNKTGGALDLASGTVRADVIKH